LKISDSRPPVADPRPYADFIASRLLRTLPGSQRRAIAETELPIDGDDWFWTDDNAKVLELLSLPALWRRMPGPVSETLRFLLDMCQGPLVYRRGGAPRLEVVRHDQSRGQFIHAFMNVKAELDRGEVSLGMRFHDGRTAWNAVFGGNYIRLKVSGREHRVELDDQVFETLIDADDDRIVLQWRSRVTVVGDGLFRRSVDVGAVTYRCEIAARTMFVRVAARFDINPGVTVSDIALSFGWKQVSHGENGVSYEQVHALDAAGEVHSVRAGPGEVPLGGASYWSVVQTSQMSGFALGIHSIPSLASRVGALHCRWNRDSSLEWIGCEHVFRGVQNDHVEAVERKLITSGGFYADVGLCAGMFGAETAASDRSRTPTDFSISYDYGAEIYALARCAVVLSRSPDIGGAAHSELKAEVDEKLANLMQAYETYFITPGVEDSSILFSRSLAYVALAMACLLDAGGLQVNRESFERACELVASFERQNPGVDGRPQSGFLMGTFNDALPQVDCHAACLRVLVQATQILDRTDWVDAIDRGIDSFCLTTEPLEMWGERKADIVAVDYLDPQGRRHKLDTFWNFKAGLTLSLFAELKACTHPAIRRVAERHASRIALFEAVIHQRIAASSIHHADGVEILTSTRAGETNSETQPWVALGLAGAAADREGASCR
jgi:hypothetical protein